MNLYVFVIRRLVVAVAADCTNVVDGVFYKPSLAENDEIVRIVAAPDKEQATAMVQKSMEGVGFALYRWHCAIDLDRRGTLAAVKDVVAGSASLSIFNVIAALRYAAEQYSAVMGDERAAALRETAKCLDEFWERMAFSEARETAVEGTG